MVGATGGGNFWDAGGGTAQHYFMCFDGAFEMATQYATHQGTWMGGAEVLPPSIPV